MLLVKPSYEILTEIDGLAMLRRIELAGRTCYKSEDAISDDSVLEFVRKIIKRGHLSIIEYESFSVRFVIDRGVSHELVRHRLCAFSQESIRYCDYEGEVIFVIPPWVDMEPGKYLSLPVQYPENFKADIAWFNSMLYAEVCYRAMREQNWSPQQARSVLPNSLKTEIVVTANLREWRHIFTLRCAKAAHPQMREVICPLLEEIRGKIPVIFDDCFEEESAVSKPGEFVKVCQEVLRQLDGYDGREIIAGEDPLHKAVVHLEGLCCWRRKSANQKNSLIFPLTFIWYLLLAESRGWDRNFRYNPYVCALKKRATGSHKDKALFYAEQLALVVLAQKCLIERAEATTSQVFRYKIRQPDSLPERSE